MKNRPPVRVKWLLFSWNTFLAVLSFFMACKSMQDIFFLIQKFSVHASICRYFPRPSRGFWTTLFTLSKLLEFGDTAFLIIRKRRIIFLHWYHHISVLWVSWIATATGSSMGRYFMAMNSFVHVFMYSYFAASSLSIRLPKLVAMFITSIQILQMLGGICVVLYSHNRLANGHHCEVDPSVITYSLLMYASYFLLFLKYFYDSYLRATEEPSTEEKRTSPSATASPSNRSKSE